jgi:hypothetical protein
MKILNTFLFLLLVSSCSNKNIRPVGDEAFIIGYQQSISLDNNFTVKFSSVQESRCPEGVQCVRAGEFFATLTFRENAEVEVEAVYCVSGECIAKKNLLPESIYYSGGKVKVGSKNYSVIIEDFSPKTSKQSNQLDSYSLTLKVIEE